MSHAKALYKNNMMGLPTKVSVFDDLPTSVTLSQVNSSAGVSGTKSNDETGARVSYSVKNNGTGIDYTEVSVPGVGVFRSTSGATGFSLDRQDLVAGGFREGVNGAVYIPVADAQGNVRGYASKGGLESAYGYYAYGTVDEIANGTADDNKRWQGKEFDGEHDKYYFGARFFDPTFAMWLSPDPAGQYLNPYSYGGDPINAVDYDGRWGLSSLFTPITSVVSAVKAAINADSFGEGVGAFFIDLAGNNLAHMAEPTISATSIAWGAVSSVGGVFHATFGDGNWSDVLKPLGVSVGSLFVSEYNTWNNAIAAVSRGDYGEIFTNLASADINSLATDYYAFQYSTNKGFGSQEYTYEGSYEGSGGHRNQIWGQKTNDHGTERALNLGQNIVLYGGYYEMSDDEKKSTLVHEFVHARQQSKYGLGGITTRRLFRSEDKPAEDDGECGMFGFTCAEVIGAFDSYNHHSNLNYADIEAELNEQAGENSEYWFDAPVFY